MDPAYTDVLVGVGHFIHLYTPLFYRPFYSLLIDMGNRMGYALQKEKRKDRFLPFHDPVGFITLGPLTINACTKLDHFKSNSNTFEEPQNNGLNKAR